ncbi:MAG: alpha/beta hydrolase [Geobacteraceae bacterium]|nr:alpha/beta hydrolase [Geobacteraceae bacterium]
MSSQRTNGEYIEIKDDIFLHLRDWGVGPAIVFIPGWPFGHEMFEYQFTQLPQQGYRCIGISMRGFGRSSKPWGDYTYDVFADDLEAVLQSLELTNVTLVGFSMGGAVALRYITRYSGGRIANLVLCAAAAPSFTKRPDFPFGLEPGAVDSFIKGCHSDRAKLNADFGQMFFKESTVVTPQLLDWFQSLGMEASPHATAACLATLRDSDLRDDLQSVKVPTWIFHGLHDRICPFELAETMTAPTDGMPAVAKAMAAGAEAVAGGIPGAALIRFENSGHALFYEEKDKFNAELINVIEKKNPGAGKFFGPAAR